MASNYGLSKVEIVCNKMGTKPNLFFNYLSGHVNNRDVINVGNSDSLISGFRVKCCEERVAWVLIFAAWLWTKMAQSTGQMTKIQSLICLVPKP